MVRRTGWTWEQAEAQLDLHRLQALNQEWERMPPVDDLVGAFLGFEPPPSDKRASPDEGAAEAADASNPNREDAGFAEFERLFSMAGGRIS